MEIFPAIDLRGGRCVRLTQGRFDKEKVYSEDPLAVAQAFARAGLRRLHLVDLDGARSGRIANLPVVQRVADGSGLHIDFGGGITDETDLDALFAAGVRQVNIGSLAVREPDRFAQWLTQFGAERIILSADSRDGMTVVDGWQRASGETVEQLIARAAAQGVSYVSCTAVTRDGLLTGPDVELYARLRGRFPELKLIASGGVHSIDDVRRLAELGMYGVIVGRALYEGLIDPEELSRFVC